MPEEKRDTSLDIVEVIFILLILGALYQSVLVPFIDRIRFASYPFSLPPETLEEEKAFLGTLLEGRITLGEVTDKVSPDFFRSAKNRIIYDSMLIMRSDGIPITRENLEEELKKTGVYGFVGGDDYLDELLEEAAFNFGERIGGIFSSSFIRRLEIGLNWMGLLSLIGIVFVAVRYAKIRKARLIELLSVSPDSHGAENHRWQRILLLLDSDSPSDWKIAIIEADTILEEIVNRMGYTGDTLGEKMKNIEISDFNTLQEAWEAHKFRNEVAHTSKDITQREVRRIIGLYKDVFEEFEYL